MASVGDILSDLHALLQRRDTAWYVFGGPDCGEALAGRSKDLDDVRGIVEKQGPALDQVRIRNVLERLELALDRSDLLKVYESIRHP